MININNISKSFQKHEVLKNITLNIADGESIAIIGQSGVGKSVLLKHINGLLKPDHGSILIDEFNISNATFNNKQKIRKKMSMVFQFGALFDSLTIKDNILLALNNLTSLNREDKEQRIKEVLEQVNLSNIENLFPHDISGGMRKRVGIARAIAIKPDYILYDEPTTGLDPITTDKICKLISKIIKKRRNTSIIVTHEMKIVNEVANKVVMLYEGNIIFDGSPLELNSSEDKYIRYFISGKRV